MKNNYDKTDYYEKKLFLLLYKIKQRAGAFLGEASLTKLFHFICGYAQATLDFEVCDYSNIIFDKEFDAYIKEKVPHREWSHWHLILCEDRTEEEAFFAFYEYLDCFIREKKKVWNTD